MIQFGDNVGKLAFKFPTFKAMVVKIIISVFVGILTRRNTVAGASTAILANRTNKTFALPVKGINFAQVNLIDFYAQVTALGFRHSGNYGNISVGNGRG